MKRQAATETLFAYRLGDANGDHTIWDATGSTISPGRWNSATTPVVYASEHFATAMLEKLVLFAGLVPPNQHYVRVTIPEGMPIETVTPDYLPDWASPSMEASRAYGDDWAAARRSAVLRVPSIVARIEWNFVFNPAHKDFARLRTTEPLPVWWDERFFTL